MIASTLFLAGACFAFGLAARDLFRMARDWCATHDAPDETTEFDHRIGDWARMVGDTAGWR